jgi:transcription initiation factor TFIIE subunit alpha
VNGGLKLSKTTRSRDDTAKITDPSEDDLFKIAKSIIAEIYGKNSNDLLTYLMKNEYVVEETLSQDTSIKSNEGRKILQYLSDEAIVVPDKMKVGESTLHLWRLNKPALVAFIVKKLKRAKEKLDLRLKFESNNTIYKCPTCKKIYTLEDAYVNDFYCPHDGSLLTEEVDRDKRFKVIAESIEKLDYLIKKIERSRY